MALQSFHLRAAGFPHAGRRTFLWLLKLSLTVSFEALVKRSIEALISCRAFEALVNSTVDSTSRSKLLLTESRPRRLRSAADATSL